MNERFIKNVVEKLRDKLLDRSKRNPLISFRHSERSRKQIRIVNLLIDQAFAALETLKSIAIQPLPSFESPDEQMPEFIEALKRVKQEDKDYLNAVKALGEKPPTKSLLKLERKLRDQLRSSLSMAPIKNSPEEYAKILGISPNYDLSKGPYKGVRKQLQTILYSDDLERKLSGIYEQAHLSESETGINTLQFAFGFLEWYENENSEEPIYSPLTLYPVQINREISNGEYVYTVSSREEDLSDNICLLERLKEDFAINPLRLKKEESPEHYLARFEILIKKHRSWKVHKFITLSFFSFAKLVMYHDLESALSTKLPDNSVLSKLIEGTESLNNTSFAEDYEVDKPEINSRLQDVILDADSSQLSAIVDVLEGENIVIQGPPGTGKSQTITNIIAVAIAAGKSVLFIAEKRAALEVVKKRLDDVGLGTFCLELHSNKTRKTDVLASLKDWTNQQHSHGKKLIPIEARLAAHLNQIKNTIGDYVSVLHTPFGKTGETLHSILWMALRLRYEASELPPQLSDVTIGNATELTKSDIQKNQDALRALEIHLKANLSDYPSIEVHPWYGLAQANHSPDDSKLLQVYIADSIKTLKDLFKSVSVIRHFGKSLELLSVNEIQKLVNAISNGFIIEQNAAFDIAHVINENLDSVKKALENTEALWITERELAGYIDSDADNRVQVKDITELSNLVQRLDITIFSPAEIPSLIGPAQDILNNWTELQAIIARIANILSIDSRALTFRHVNWLLLAIGFAKEASSRILEYRHPAILNPDNCVPIAIAVRPIKRLRDEREFLGNVFKKTISISRKDISAAATCLGNFTLLSFFQRRYWAARRLYYSIAISSKHVSNRHMSQMLERLISFQDDLEQFELDQKLKNILGDLWNGIDSDIEGISEMASWSKKVAEEFPTYDDFSKKIRKWLFEAQPGEIALLKEFANHPLRELFLDIISPRRVSPRKQFIDELNERSERVIGLTRVNALCRLIGLRSNLRFEEILKIKKTASDRDRLRETLASEEIKNILSAHYPINRENIDRIRSTVTLVNSLNKLPLADKWIELLLEHDCRRVIEEVSSALQNLNTPLIQAMESINKIESLCHNSTPMLRDNTLIGVIERLEKALSNPAALGVLIDFLRAEEHVIRVGAGPVLDAYRSAKIPFKKLEMIYSFSVYNSILKAAQEKFPQLKESVSFQFKELRERFVQIENELLDLRRKKIASQLLSRSINKGTSSGKASDLTQLGLIIHELSKQRKHISIRELLSRAGSAIRQMKPCFMMSPLSVAQFLSGDFTFDVVIMDEASQLRPEDAVGAVMRAKQVVIVGDPKQLPPTNFFNFSDDAPSIDTAEDVDSNVDQESILDLAYRSFRPVRRLRWHYRSRHESLIAFSNHAFYDKNLIIFPSPFPGLTHGIKFIPVDGLYDKRKNLPEAQKIVEDVIKFMEEHPDRSLGIVSINQEQRDLIAELIETRTIHDPIIQKYLSKWQESLEPFFVKNLENVQGDERDVIVISTVYGKDTNGNLFQRFGPINGVMGHRRLNVLFTRAKEQMLVFSSINPEEIITDNKSSEGLRAFKEFLKFAKNRRLDTETQVDSNREPDSDFEVFVMERLREKGYQVVPQVGVAGYSIDLAVQDPHLPSKYVLGIECDGATYHSAKCARDRDKTRQEILEKLGWTIHRIWSTDWFQHTDRELAKVLELLPPIAA